MYILPRQKSVLRRWWQAQALCGWAGRPVRCHHSREEKPSIQWGRQGCPPWGLRTLGWGKEQLLVQVSGTERGVGGLGQASHPRPRTARCVSWTGIQGNCASPHSVCSEANAFLSHCLCWRLVVGTPITSSLGERPRCLESGCGRPDSNGGERRPGGSIPAPPMEGPQGMGVLPKACPGWSRAGCLGCHPVERERGC